MKKLDHQIIQYKEDYSKFYNPADPSTKSLFRVGDDVVICKDKNSLISLRSLIENRYECPYCLRKLSSDLSTIDFIKDIPKVKKEESALNFGGSKRYSTLSLLFIGGVFLSILFLFLIIGLFVFNVFYPSSTTPTSFTLINTPTNIPLPISTPTYPTIPRFTIRDFDQTKDQNVDVFWSESFISNFSWASSPGTYFWEVNYPSNTPLLIYYGWCALDRQILDKNLGIIKFIFILDGYDITNELKTSYGTTEMDNEDWVCYEYAGVVENLISGTHNFIYSHTILDTLNDGLYNFQEGDYVNNFKISIP